MKNYEEVKKTLENNLEAKLIKVNKRMYIMELDNWIVNINLYNESDEYIFYYKSIKVGSLKVIHLLDVERGKHIKFIDLLKTREEAKNKLKRQIGINEHVWGENY